MLAGVENKCSKLKLFTTRAIHLTIVFIGDLPNLENYWQYIGDP